MTTTRFEDTQGVDLTTLADEDVLFAALAATGRVQVDVLGMSSGNTHPVRMVTIDTPSTPSNAPTVLWIGGQHGNEHASREAVLSTIRDLAETADPALVGLLGRCRFHVIPTANPNGFPTNRDVPGKGNMNRHHISLFTPEAQHIQQAITDTRPVAILDCHEHFSPSPDWQFAQLLPGQQPMADATINALSADLMQACFTSLAAANIAHGLYSVPSDDPGIMSVSASARGCVSLLVETAASKPRMERFGEYRVMRDAILAWLVDKLTSVASARTLAEARQMQRGLVPGQFDLANATIMRSPQAYTLPSPGPKHLDVFGLEHTDDGTTVTVPLAQPSFTIIPFLLDPGGIEPVAAATRVEYPPPPPPVDPFYGTPYAMKANIDGTVCDIERVLYNNNGNVVEVFLPGSR